MNGELIAEFWAFVQKEGDKLIEQSLAHIGLTFLSLFLAIAIAMPLGVWITRKEKLAGLVLGFAGVMQTVPSIALLGFLIPFLGIGTQPAVFALFLYALLPIIRNTYTGIKEVEPSIKEAAAGMGMNDWQILSRIELPLALPVIFAGIRTATVINVGVATLAAYIGAGGLGEFIFGGIALNNSQMILAGAIPAALLALAFDFVLARMQRLERPKMKLAVSGFVMAMTLFVAVYYVPGLLNFKQDTRMKGGFEPEFIGRMDGYLGLQQSYGLDLETLTMSTALMYGAVVEGEVDVISGYSTDGRIASYNLKVLEDDHGVFPPYFAAPIFREETLARYPALSLCLQWLVGRLPDSTMTRLNYEVDEQKLSPQEVALSFLVNQGLVDENANPLPRFQKALQDSLGIQALNGRDAKPLVFGSKIFSEQYILIEMFRYLIEAYTPLEVELKPGLGGTKICFDALKAGEIDSYPEYTGTGLQVIVGAESHILDSLGGNPDKVYQFVDERFRTLYGIDWLEPLGFNNTYALMMRGDRAEALGIKTISDLKRIANP